MALPRKFLIVLSLVCTPFFLQGEEEKAVDKGHILYLMHSHELTKSLDQYQKLCLSLGHQDFETLQQLALLLLQQGATQEDVLSQQLTMFGAGLATSSLSLDILGMGLSSPELQTQLTSLHFISALQDERTEQLLMKALKSDFLMTRLEAAYQMAEKKHPKALGLIEALMHQVPPPFKPFFPLLFAKLGTPEALIFLKGFLNDSDPFCRIEALSNIALFARDDLLPLVRAHLSSASAAEKEACCKVFETFKDSSQLKNLKTLAKSEIDTVQIASLKALTHLGDVSARKKLEELAENEQSLFAITALAEFSGTEKIFSKLLASPDFCVRVNAALSLLQRNDPRCLPILKEIFIRDPRDLAFFPFSSPGKALFAWKILSSASQRLQDPSDRNAALHFKEMFLRKTLDLPEKDFLLIASWIFENNQKELIPTLVSLLENAKSEQTIQLLKKQTEKAGAPLIRDYCHLALFRLHEKGPHEAYVLNWIAKKNQADLIKLRPFTPWKDRFNEKFDPAITPEETSSLLIEMYLAVASSQKEASIQALIEAIKRGNPKNRFVLAGLLLRSTE